MRPCKACNGTKVYDSFFKGQISCPYCEGQGSWPEPNWKQIIQDITVPRKGEMAFRKSAPMLDRDTIRGSRAYYVWRLTRFHGGADVTIPVMAEMYSHYDPYQKELNDFAELIAEQVFGTSMAAAYRWGTALGLINKPIDGLPATAYFSGPVADEDKPLEELAELI